MATIGTPAAMASSTTLLNPSLFDACTRTSLAPIEAGIRRCVSSSDDFGVRALS